MRRTFGLVLIGLGAFLLVFAPMLRFYAYPRLAVVPLDQYTQTVSYGPGATILDIGSFSEIQTDLTSVRTVRGDVEASTDDVAVWETFVNTTDPEGETRSAYTERGAFDRTTGETVEGYGENFDGDPVRHEGLWLKFPFDTQQQDYEFWDNTLLEARPAVFDGEEDIQGLATYRFVQTIEPEVWTQQEVPGSLVGEDADAVEADRSYSNVRTLWVEPNTGVIIRGQEQQRSTLQVDGEDRVTVTEVTIAYDDETVSANVDEYGGQAGQLRLIRSTLPLALALLGLGLLVGGFLLAASGRRGREGTRRRSRQRPVETTEKPELFRHT